MQFENNDGECLLMLSPNNIFKIKKNLGFVMFVLFMIGAVHYQALAQDAASPQASLESFIETIRSMEFPIKDEASHARLVKKADSFLDLDSVGQKAIAEHWASLTDEQRKKFLQLFWNLIEKTAYPRSHDFMGKLNITYPETNVDATGTTVKSIVHQSEDGVDAEVIYHLTNKSGTWVVDDVILDDVSIVEDLKYQFNKIIKESSFDGLLSKMTERLAQADKSNS